MFNIINRFYLLINIMTKHDTLKTTLYMLLLCIFALCTMTIFEDWSIPDTLWWFCITITTVGYGDMFPVTIAGKISALLIMFIGIGLGALVLSNIASSFITNIIAKGRLKMNGLKDFSQCNDHIVIMGWRGDETKQLIHNILADKNRINRKIIIVSNSLEHHPLQKEFHVNFVKGQLTSEDVCIRSGISTASKVIINAKDDQTTIFTTLAVVHYDDDDPAEIVAHIKDPDNIQHIKRIANHITIVYSLANDLIVQEMQDKGVSELLSYLLSNHQPSTGKPDIDKINNKTIYRYDITPNCLYRFGFASELMKRKGYVAIGGITQRDEMVIYPDDHISMKSLFIIGSERYIGDIQ